MWRCANCGTEVEEKYAHCWQCGVAKAPKQKPQPAPVAATSVPEFASYEELAKVPSRPPWILRRGPLQRITIIVILLIIFKLAAAPFVGKYGVYVVAGVAVVALILILWGFFRRDPSEGVGIKLN